MGEYVLEMSHISKYYGENQVLKDINLKVEKGEIYALLGENGAGKSTLMNILFGMPVIQSTGGYNGEIKVDGEVIKISSPEEAMKLGIGMVHQEFMLIPGFTVTENIKLNREKYKNNIYNKVAKNNMKSLDWEVMKKDAQKALDRLDVGIEEYAEVAGLPVGYKQFVEIAREIDKSNVKILVFDEPTAVLTESEAENLIDTMRKLSSQGIAIIFITHRLDEVMACTQHLSVLRDGVVVDSCETKNTNVNDLAEKMVGREIEGLKTKENYRDFSKRGNILELRNFRVGMAGETVRGIDLDIKEGEIFGLAGLAGQGKVGIANGIMGLYPTSGEIYVKGKKIELNSPLESLKNKIAFVSEDRKGVGLLLTESITENIIITDRQINNSFLYKFGPIKFENNKLSLEHSEQMIQEFDIRCTGPAQPVGRLSGGNQQKVCLARAFTLKPDLLLVSEPTRGIDIGAKKLVLDKLVDINNTKGTTVVMTSSELGELRSVCDRIAIVSEGKIMGILKPYEDDVKFGLLMSGTSLDQEMDQTSVDESKETDEKEVDKDGK